MDSIIQHLLLESKKEFEIYAFYISFFQIDELMIELAMLDFVEV